MAPLTRPTVSEVTQQHILQPISQSSFLLPEQQTIASQPQAVQVRPSFLATQPLEQTVLVQQVAVPHSKALPTSTEYYTHYVGGSVSSASETPLQTSSIQVHGVKRRFTEEKEEKMPPENLLGYQVRDQTAVCFMWPLFATILCLAWSTTSCQLGNVSESAI
jgi:hypothetical protein